MLDARAALRARIERKYGPAVDAEAIAAATIALVPGYLHAKVILGDVDAEQYLRGVEGLGALIA